MLLWSSSIFMGCRLICGVCDNNSLLCSFIKDNRWNERAAVLLMFALFSCKHSEAERPRLDEDVEDKGHIWFISVKLLLMSRKKVINMCVFRLLNVSLVSLQTWLGSIRAEALPDWCWWWCVWLCCSITCSSPWLVSGPTKAKVELCNRLSSEHWLEATD